MSISTNLSVVSGVAGRPPAAAPATGSPTSPASVQGSEDQFMKLLISQMKYQDPLNPMDNAQMTSQIAQINTVSGIKTLNQTMQTMSSQFGALQSVQAAGLLGKTGLVPSSLLPLNQGRADFGVELPKAVDSLKVTISDAQGKPVFTQDLGPQAAGLSGFQWDGLANDGSRLPDGAYQMQFAASSAAQPVTVTGLASAVITSASVGNGSTRLGLGALGDHDLSEIRRIN